MTSNAALNFLMSQSLQKLWGSLNILQLILDIPLISCVVMPSDSTALFTALVDITTFDIFNS
jgi:hypothetical protein